MKILHTTGDWKWTGPAEPMLLAARGLRDRGHQVHVLYPHAPEGHAGALDERARKYGFDSAAVIGRRQGYVPLRDSGDVRRLRRLLVRERYDVVHTHHTRDHLLAIRARRGLDTKLVASWHHGDPIPARRWNRWLFGPRGADAITVLSEHVASAVRAELGGPAERVAVVPGVVEVDRFLPRPRRPELLEQLRLEPEHVVLGVVARIQPHRRFELLLEAFERAQRQAPELRLLVVGRGTRAHEVLERPVEQRGLGELVRRAGYRRHDYLDVLALVDALVFLVPGSDGSCRAVLEAMSMQIPVIASRRGVLPETVMEGETGRVVDEDAEALAEAMVEVARRPELWKARGAAARAAVLARHTIESQAERLERLYRSLVSG